MTTIRERRLALGWTQAELARRVGTVTEVVSRWENGRHPRRLYAEKLERVFRQEERRRR